MKVLSKFEDPEPKFALQHSNGSEYRNHISCHTYMFSKPVYANLVVDTLAFGEVDVQHRLSEEGYYGITSIALWYESELFDDETIMNMLTLNWVSNIVRNVTTITVIIPPGSNYNLIKRIRDDFAFEALWEGNQRGLGFPVILPPINFEFKKAPSWVPRIGEWWGWN